MAHALSAPTALPSAAVTTLKESIIACVVEKKETKS
jgi:hypothetical protein